MTTADDEMTMDMNESVTDMVVSYTNEDDATAAEYATYFGQTGDDQPGGVSGYSTSDG